LCAEDVASDGETDDLGHIRVVVRGTSPSAPTSPWSLHAHIVPEGGAGHQSRTGHESSARLLGSRPVSGASRCRPKARARSLRVPAGGPGTAKLCHTVLRRRFAPFVWTAILTCRVPPGPRPIFRPRAAADPAQRNQVDTAAPTACAR
jgi:hypothetical protein